MRLFKSCNFKAAIVLSHSLTVQETHQEMRYPNVTLTSVYFVTILAFNAPDGGVPLWDDLRKFLHGGQRMTKVQNGEEILPKVSAP